MLLELIPENQPVICSVDDTATQHRGQHVYGKGRHRDACRLAEVHPTATITCFEPSPGTARRPRP